jgi:hypothetical protein
MSDEQDQIKAVLTKVFCGFCGETVQLETIPLKPVAYRCPNCMTKTTIETTLGG